MCPVSIEGRRGIQACDRQGRLGFHSATCRARKRLVIQPALDCATCVYAGVAVCVPGEGVIFHDGLMGVSISGIGLCMPLAGSSVGGGGAQTFCSFLRLFLCRRSR